MISSEKLSISYNKNPIIENLSLSIEMGKITTIIGPNGCGKSTLLKTLARLLQPNAGEVLLDHLNITSMKSKEVARKIAILSQFREQTEGVTVQELVSYGRFPYQKTFQRLNDKDKAAISWAIRATQLEGMENQLLQQLSGGQLQRAWIALALAQETPIIFLDEPTTYLDIPHQLEILYLLRKLNVEKQKTIVMVLHDINLAARFSDQIIAMKKGEIISKGTVTHVLTKKTLADVFSVSAEITYDPISKVPSTIAFDLLNNTQNEKFSQNVVR
ncbi:MAG: ABC transporter ATP-binding protein [Bacilli bacterium]